MKQIIIGLLLSCGIMGQLHAQSDETKIVSVVKPSIMIVPFKTKDEEYRQLLEENRDMRVAVSKVTEYFLANNYRTVDFLQKITTLEELSEGMEAANQKTLEQRIAENNLADVVVYVDAEYIRGSDNYVDLTLTAKDVYSAQPLSTKSAQSRAGSFDDINLYTKNAIEKCAGEFMTTLETQFREIVKRGKSIRLSITLKDNLSFSLQDDADDDLNTYADLMSDFLMENAHENYMSCPINLDTKYECDDYRVPIRNAAKNDATYLPNDLSRLVRKFLLRELGLHSQAKIVGNAVFITICGTQKCN